MSVISNTIKSQRLLSKPRVTEKATFLSGAKNPVYTFEVPVDATKSEILKEVKDKYNVTPEKINIINLPAKQIVIRGKKGSKPAVKKALVFLTPGEKIEFV